MRWTEIMTAACELLMSAGCNDADTRRAQAMVEAARELRIGTASASNVERAYTLDPSELKRVDW